MLKEIPKANNNSSKNTQKEFWFLFLNDKYEGPYSEFEIKSKLSLNIINENTMIWADGFEDWKLVSDIDTFNNSISIPIQFQAELHNSLKSDFQLTDNYANHEINNIEKVVINEEIKTLNIEKDDASEIKLNNQPEINKNEINSLEKLLSEVKFEWTKSKLNELELNKYEPYKFHKPWSYNDSSTQLSTQINSENKSASTKINYILPIKKHQRKLFIGLVVSILFFISMNIFFKLRIPNLPGIDHSEAREMYAAMTESLEQYSPTAVTHLSKSDITKPIFYIASNLPENTELKLYIEGISETLLDAFNISIEATIKIHNGIAQSPIFVQEDGKVFPIGEYKVIVKCIACDHFFQTKKLENNTQKEYIINEKHFFLGGIKDQNYDQKLKLYHEKIKVQAMSELIELKQLIDNIEKQLNETNNIFVQWTSSEYSKNQWAEFHNKWTHFQNQLSKISKQWNPQAVQYTYYYGNFYSLLKNILEMTSQIHKTQNDWILKNFSSESLESAIYEKSSIVQSTLLTIRTKITYIEHLPSSANGMPPR